MQINLAEYWSLWYIRGQTQGPISFLTTYLWAKTEHNWHRDVSVSLQRVWNKKSKRQALPPGSVTLMPRLAELEFPAQHQQKVLNLIERKSETEDHTPVGVLQMAVQAVSCWRVVTCLPNKVAEHTGETNKAVERYSIISVFKASKDPKMSLRHPGKWCYNGALTLTHSPTRTVNSGCNSFLTMSLLPRPS